MTSRPPAFAAWILTRLGPDDEVLAGDVFEEYQRRRSRLWFWRQVLAAVLMTTICTAREHKWLTLRALAIGWASVLILWQLDLHHWISYRLLGGWVLDQLILGFGAHPVPMLWGTYLRFLPVWVILGVGPGWIVGRFSGEHRAAMVLAFAATMVPLSCYTAVSVWSPLRPIPVPYPVLWTLTFTLLPILPIVGGLVAGGSASRSR